jgi:hypothetical protein
VRISAEVVAGRARQGACMYPEKRRRSDVAAWSADGDIVDTLRQRSYSAVIFSSLSRLAVMDSSTELVPLIHVPPSRRRSSGKGP